MVAIQSKSRTPFRKATTSLQNSKPDEGQDALNALRKIERATPHQWDEDERKLLAILYRWYQADHPTTIPQVFNSITDLNLRHTTIQTQFEDLKRYGGRAFPEFGQVMAIPFNDLEGHYDEIHGIIEDASRDLGVYLPRRKFEVKFNLGTAQFAKSSRTRRVFKSRVRRAAQKERKQEQELVVQMPDLGNLSIHAPALGSTTLSWNRGEAFLDAEDFVDGEASPIASSNASPMIQRRSSLPTSHHVAFRVWDANSRTDFTEEQGFTSQMFSDWRGQFLPPFTPEGEGMQAIKLLTNRHLSKKGGASAFVSVSTSLLQMLVKASAMVEPMIAVVALDHPLLNTPHKTLEAAEVLRMLKRENQASWARYRGHTERLIWANLPREAILSHFPLSNLYSLPTNTQAFLSLDEFEPTRKTLKVSSRLKEKSIVLNTNTARAIGCIAKAFGMDRGNVSVMHIRDFVSRIIDGWQVGESYNDSNIALTFTMSLASQIYSTQDMITAFQSGVQQGRDTVAYYSRRRSRHT